MYLYVTIWTRYICNRTIGLRKRNSVVANSGCKLRPYLYLQVNSFLLFTSHNTIAYMSPNSHMKLSQMNFAIFNEFLLSSFVIQFSFSLTYHSLLQVLFFRLNHITFLHLMLIINCHFNLTQHFLSHLFFLPFPVLIQFFYRHFIARYVLVCVCVCVYVCVRVCVCAHASAFFPFKSHNYNNFSHSHSGNDFRVNCAPLKFQELATAFGA